MNDTEIRGPPEQSLQVELWKETHTAPYQAAILNVGCLKQEVCWPVLMLLDK